ncbi:MAG: insulinase family protein [Chloroflexi bacterium]|nr:insulinase family protein [Chloroflexota bacterium]
MVSFLITMKNEYPNEQTICQHTLPNGITVLVYENFASETVVVEGLVRAGAILEPKAQAGLANATAVMLMRGTQQQTFRQIYEALESVGADCGFSSDYNDTSFSAHALAEDFDLILTLLAQSLRQPTFPEAQYERVQGQLMTALQMRTHDPAQMAMLSFRDLLYPHHPYGVSQLGYVETVKLLNHDDLAQFHAHHFGPQGMIITVVGAIKASAAVAKITAVFNDWRVPQQQPLPIVPDVMRPDGVVETAVTIPDKSQSEIIVGLPGPRRNAPDYLDISLMNTILGVFGMMGRIGKRVREEEGLAYYAYSRLNGGLGPDPWMAAAGVAPEHVTQAITSMLAEIDRIQNELVTPEELADCKAYRIGSMPVGLETNGGIADVITDLQLYGLGMDYLQQFPLRINQITPERIQTAARKYLSTDQIGIAVAGP